MADAHHAAERLVSEVAYAERVVFERPWTQDPLPDLRRARDRLTSLVTRAEAQAGVPPVRP